MGSAADDEVELRSGEEHSVRLEGLGTAGYRWRPEVEGDAEAVEVRSAGTEAAEGSGVVGAGATEVFTVRANRPGEVTVRFLQRRPWEPDDTPAANEHAVRLRVT
jgi:predicted secreted protein